MASRMFAGKVVSADPRNPHHTLPTFPGSCDNGNIMARTILAIKITISYFIQIINITCKTQLCWSFKYWYSNVWLDQCITWQHHFFTSSSGVCHLFFLSFVIEIRINPTSNNAQNFFQPHYKYQSMPSIITIKTSFKLYIYFIYCDNVIFISKQQTASKQASKQTRQYYL